MKNDLFYQRFLVFAKVEKILGKYKKLCRYCEREDSYLFWPPPVSFGKLKIF
nr:MAG TPA: Tryptophyllin-3 skin active peptide [Bacteriophage sp.]